MVFIIRSVSISNFKKASELKSKDSSDLPFRTNSWSTFHERCRDLIVMLLLIITIK